MIIINTKVSFALLIAFCFFISSCGNSSHSGLSDSLEQVSFSKEQLLDSIDAQQVKMSASKTYVPQQAMGALRLYLDYSNRFPEDSMTPEFLFRASDIAQGLGNYQQAADLLEKIIEQYPGYNKYADACFTAALIYDDHLEKVNFGADRAIQLYDYVIEKYPNTYYAESAKTLKEYVGKPDSVYDKYIEEQMKANQGK